MKLCLAGGEAWWETFRDFEVRYVLFSYHYLRSQKDYAAMAAWMEECKAKSPGRYFFMLDSGAFTFQGSKGIASTGYDLERYVEEYLRFLRTHDSVHLFDTVAEVDVYAAPWGHFGTDDPDEHQEHVIARVEKWRERLHKIVGARLIPVVHTHHTREDWQALCRDPRFAWIGLSSALGGEDMNAVALQKAVIAEAHRYGKKAHGFAMTRLRTDLKYLRNYDTVDSTSWLRADKFGATFIYHRGYLRVLGHLQKHHRKHYSAYFRAIGLDPEKILGTHTDHDFHCPGPDSLTKGCQACNDQLHELRASSIIAWRQMAEKFDSWKLSTDFTRWENAVPSNIHAASQYEARKIGSTGKPPKNAVSALKKPKGRRYPNPDRIPFAGYACPHYRARPPAIQASLTCLACPNVLPCLRLEREAAREALPAPEDLTHATPPLAITDSPPDANAAASDPATDASVEAKTLAYLSSLAQAKADANPRDETLTPENPPLTFWGPGKLHPTPAQQDSLRAMGWQHKPDPQTLPTPPNARLKNLPLFAQQALIARAAKVPPQPSTPHDTHPSTPRRRADEVPCSSATPTPTTATTPSPVDHSFTVDPSLQKQRFPGTLVTPLPHAETLQNPQKSSVDGEATAGETPTTTAPHGASRLQLLSPKSASGLQEQWPGEGREEGRNSASRLQEQCSANATASTENPPPLSVSSATGLQDANAENPPGKEGAGGEVPCSSVTGNATASATTNVDAHERASKTPNENPSPRSLLRSFHLPVLQPGGGGNSDPVTPAKTSALSAALAAEVNPYGSEEAPQQQAQLENPAGTAAVKTSAVVPPPEDLFGSSAIDEDLDRSGGGGTVSPSSGFPVTVGASQNPAPSSFTLPSPEDQLPANKLWTGGLDISRFRQTMPRLECNTCMLTDECPKFRAHQVCAYNDLFDAFDTRDVNSVVAQFQVLVQHDQQRTMMAMLQERLTTGGQIDPRVTQQMNGFQKRLTEYTSFIRDLQATIQEHRDREEEERLREEERARAQSEETLTLHYRASETEAPTLRGRTPGILSRLFGGQNPTQNQPLPDPPSQDTITVLARQKA